MRLSPAVRDLGPGIGPSRSTGLRQNSQYSSESFPSMDRMLARTHPAHWYSTRRFSVTSDHPSGSPSSGTSADVPQ